MSYHRIHHPMSRGRWSTHACLLIRDFSTIADEKHCQVALYLFHANIDPRDMNNSQNIVLASQQGDRGARKHCAESDKTTGVQRYCNARIERWNVSKMNETPKTITYGIHLYLRSELITFMGCIQRLHDTQIARFRRKSQVLDSKCHNNLSDIGRGDEQSLQMNVKSRRNSALSQLGYASTW